ncbi:hypothetical protein [Paraburkholderia tropica]|uniref:hypothetical protein n=1 Tax=Paraburkholderia tropica TaxID=92647 RepID=UPI001F22FF03|nr:hypothetical protein [Paraburkholderia tropica]
MKFKCPVSLNVLSPMSMHNREDFIDAVRTYCESLPEAMPEKWGWWEPLDKIFDPNEIDQLVPQQGKCETVYWRRHKSPKAEGSFSVRWHSKSPKVQDTHSNINLTLELGKVRQEALVSWLKTASVRARADLALVDVLSDEYRDFAIESASSQSGEWVHVVSHVLRHWLPDVFWGTVFGIPYVKLFGKDRLLNAPVAIAEEIGDDMVYIQLTDKISDALTAPEFVQDRRANLKAHLGVDAFYEHGRGYDRLQCGPRGDVFVVPDFKLLNDE